MERYFAEKAPFERLLLLGSGVWVVAKILEALLQEHDTCNYAPYNKKKLISSFISF